MPCTHPSRLFLSAKCADMCFVRWPNGQESNGYPPRIAGLSSNGDYLKFTVCTACGKILGLASAEEILDLAPEPETP